MNAKFIIALVALVALVANSYAQSQCATQILGSRNIDSVVIFSDLRALPELVLNDVVDGSILRGQAWTVVRFDSFSTPTVSLEIDCGVDFSSCSPTGNESQTTRTQVDTIGSNTFSEDSSFGFIFGDQRTTTIDLNCEEAFNNTVSLSASAKIGIPENLVVVSGNGDDSNTCTMTTSVEWTFGNFDLRPYAGRGFVLTFVDFEREKENPLDGQITITQANGNVATATRELRVGANSQTTFIFEWADFSNDGNLNAILANAVGVKISIFGIADDDFVVDFLATYSHFVTGRLNAGCPGATSTCNGVESCTVSLTGVEQAPVPNTDHNDVFELNSSSYYSTKSAPTDVSSLPYTSFDWAAYVACGSNGYFWFTVNPGRYTVTMTCESDDPSPVEGYDFCTAFISTAFAADRTVHNMCGGNSFNVFTWADIQCITNRTIPVCAEDSQVYPSIGLQSPRSVDNDLIPCINFEFTLVNVDFSFPCPEDVDIDCGVPFPTPVFQASDPTCNIPVDVVIVSDVVDDANCCVQTRTVTAMAENEAGSKTCVWTATRTDTTPPVFTGLSDFQTDYELDCDGCTALGECTDRPRFTDNCCDVDVTFTETEDVTTCATTLNRVWAIADECGNARERTVSQTVVLKDMEPATITCPEDVTIDCDFEDFPRPNVSGRPSVSDKCTRTSFRFEDVIAEDECDVSCEGGLTRTFFGKDECYPEVSCVQQIKITDEEPPELVIPDDVTDIECGDSLFPVNAGSATACDTCDPRPSVYFEDTEKPLVCDLEACLWKRSIDRLWFAQDRCEQVTIADSVQRVGQMPCPPCKQLIDVCINTCVFNRNRLCNECESLTQRDINVNNLKAACGNGENNASKCKGLRNKCTRVCLADGVV